MFLLNFMAKEIRMGTVTSYNPYYSLTINRTDSLGNTYDINYVFDGINLQRSTNPLQSVNGPINSNDVSVSGRFYVTGVTPGDDRQPRVTIVIKVETTGSKPEQRAVAELQTTLSQHNLEI